jgi:VWFA-related protein
MLLVRLAVIAAVTATWVFAQTPPYTLKVNVPLVSVEVTAFDAGGRPITTLGQEDFHVYEDGAPREIRNFAPVSTPYSVFLLFDRSGSTESQWPLMQRAVARFLENLRPQDRVAMAAFDEDFEMLLDWTENRRDAILGLPGLLRPRAPGATDFYGAMDRVVRRQFRNVSGRKAVVVFSDGRDTRLYRRTVDLGRTPSMTEDRDFQRILRAIQQSNTPVYFIAINTDRNLGADDPGNDYLILKKLFPKTAAPHDFLVQVRERMEELAGRSAGRIFFPDTLDNVVPIYDQISRELGTSYSIGFAPGDGSGGRRKIEVRVERAYRVWQSRTEYDSR